MGAFTNIWATTRSTWRKRRSRRLASRWPTAAPAGKTRRTARSRGSSKRRGLQYRRRQQQEDGSAHRRAGNSKDELEALLASPDLYADGLRAVEMTQAHQQLQHDLAAAYAEWETVAEELLALELEAESVRQERLGKK